jgi:hypothetical protein
MRQDASGFAVSSRIERVKPRLARSDWRDWDDVFGSRPRPPEATDRDELIELRIAEPLAERWAAFRDRWSALTFFLFDPQSWR